MDVNAVYEAVNVVLISVFLLIPFQNKNHVVVARQPWVNYIEVVLSIGPIILCDYMILFFFFDCLWPIHFFDSTEMVIIIIIVIIL